MLIMVAISVVLMVIALENIDLAVINYNTRNHTLRSVGETATLRVLFRSLANINLEYMSNSNPYFDDRSLAYENRV